MQRLERLIPPPAAALIVALCMWGSARIFELDERASGYTLRIALLLAAAGVVIAVAGAIAFRRAGANFSPHRVDDGVALVTEGIYKYTRNPMYLGIALVLSSYGIYLLSPLEEIGPAAFVVYMTYFQVMPEERAMRAKFGADYDAYADWTRRWL